MKTKRILSFLISLLLLSSAAACGESQSSPTAPSGNADTAQVTEAPEENETTAAEVRANVPDSDFDGFSYVIITKGNEGQNIKYYLNADAESENGDTINDAIYRRNLTVEDRFNVKISQFEPSDVAATLKKSVAAGDDAYQFCIVSYASSYTLATGGYLLNMYDLQYFDTDAAWWDQDLKKQMTIAGKLFFDSGDIILYDDMRVACSYFNKGLWENYGLENPYDLVTSGKWIMDKMKELGSDVTSDIDGNGVLDQYDLWGIVSEDGGVSDFYHSAGLRQIINTGDTLEIEFGSEKAVEVGARVIEFVSDKENVFNANKIKADDIWKYASQIFQEDRALIRTSCFENIPRDYRSMDTDFGVLPFPKYNETQDKYYTPVRADGYAASVPASVQDPDRAAIIAESLAAESYNFLKPAFYDISLQGKVLRDNESEGMLDIIFGSKLYDIGYIFSIGGMTAALEGQLSKKSPDVASAMAKVKDKAQTAVDKMVATFESLG